MGVQQEHTDREAAVKVLDDKLAELQQQTMVLSLLLNACYVTIFFHLSKVWYGYSCHSDCCHVICYIQSDLEVKAAVLKHLQESLDALSSRQLVIS